jgi:hypothetical protein
LVFLLNQLQRAEKISKLIRIHTTQVLDAELVRIQECARESPESYDTITARKQVNYKSSF